MNPPSVWPQRRYHPDYFPVDQVGLIDQTDRDDKRLVDGRSGRRLSLRFDHWRPQPFVLILVLRRGRVVARG